MSLLIHQPQTNINSSLKRLVYLLRMRAKLAAVLKLISLTLLTLLLPSRRQRNFICHNYF